VSANDKSLGGESPGDVSSGGESGNKPQDSPGGTPPLPREDDAARCWFSTIVQSATWIVLFVASFD